MNMVPHAARLETGARPLPSAGDTASALIQAAMTLAATLSQGRAVDARALRPAMENAFCASDSAGAWVWKDAYEAGEAAQVLFLRRYGSAMRAKAGTSAAMLAMLARVAALLPTQTRRSEESQALQQFSTPLPLGFVASVAAGLTPTDVVLDPSAGTGLLAIFAELAGATTCECEQHLAQPLPSPAGAARAIRRLSERILWNLTLDVGHPWGTPGAPSVGGQLLDNMSNYSYCV